LRAVAPRISLRPLAIALLCLVLVPAGDAATTANAARARAKVTFELGARTGFEYRWEYTFRVRIKDRTTGSALSGLRVLATGKMNVPGHEMQTVPVRVQDEGGGLYAAKIAFYMPGEWRVRVTVRGATVLPALASFRVVLP
jgi:hypothetical protein